MEQPQVGIRKGSIFDKGPQTLIGFFIGFVLMSKGATFFSFETKSILIFVGVPVVLGLVLSYLLPRYRNFFIGACLGTIIGTFFWSVFYPIIQPCINCYF